MSGAENAGFVGDKNPFGKTDEYAEQFKILQQWFPNSYDCFRKLHPDTAAEPGFSFDAVANTNAKFDDEKREAMKAKTIAPEQERLDYCVMLRDNPSSGIDVRCSVCEVDRCDDLSDHFGLHTEFELHVSQSSTPQGLNVELK